MLKIYNSVKKEKEAFVPQLSEMVSLYVCGPTLYGDIHIGNARPIVFFDVVYRYLTMSGYNVRYVSNITDIDDKIINKAMELGVEEKAIVERNIEEFFLVLDKLNVMPVYKRPLVTEFMNSIIDFIDELIATDFAYKTVDGDVYFRVNKIEDYGKISNKDIAELVVGSRIEVNRSKESENDFVIWKNTVNGITWNANFGVGRPGWHTECAVMVREIFGNKVDIHGGGMDLKFPHHENENAQYKACYKEDIANFWMHNGFVTIDGEKMSKSDGNFITVRELLEEHDINVIRLLLLQTNYRHPINLSDDFLNQTKKLVRKIDDFSLKVFEDQEAETTLDERVINVMDDDFNTPNLISLLLEAIKNVDIELYLQIINILGLKVNFCARISELDGDVKLLLEELKKFRKDKEFESVDIVREKIANLGYNVFITRDGIRVKKI